MPATKEPKFKTHRTVIAVPVAGWDEAAVTLEVAHHLAADGDDEAIKLSLDTTAQATVWLSEDTLDGLIEAAKEAKRLLKAGS